jgi:hypothetical protein
MRTITSDGVDITRLVNLHHKYHGVPMACLVRRYREEAAQRKECSVEAPDAEHGRGAEPSCYPLQRGWILAQA